MKQNDREELERKAATIGEGAAARQGTVFIDDPQLYDRISNSIDAVMRSKYGVASPSEHSYGYRSYRVGAFIFQFNITMEVKYGGGEGPDPFWGMFFKGKRHKTEIYIKNYRVRSVLFDNKNNSVENWIWISARDHNIRTMIGHLLDQVHKDYLRL